MAASVCSQSATSNGSFSSGGRRFFELRMPRLTEPPSPNGFPSARTVSPSSKSSSCELHRPEFFVPFGDEFQQRYVPACVADDRLCFDFAAIGQLHPDPAGAPHDV